LLVPIRQVPSSIRAAEIVTKYAKNCTVLNNYKPPFIDLWCTVISMTNTEKKLTACNIILAAARCI